MGTAGAQGRRESGHHVTRGSLPTQIPWPYVFVQVHLSALPGAKGLVPQGGNPRAELPEKGSHIRQPPKCLVNQQVFIEPVLPAPYLPLSDTMEEDMINT